MRRKRGAVFLLFLFLAVIGVVFVLYQRSSRERPATLDHGWSLILVNRDYCIPEDYAPALLTLSNGEQVDERIYPALQAMFDAARAEGVYPFVTAGYRTRQEQQRLMDAKIQAYREEGYPRIAAVRQAEAWVARPGHSEHELGLAVDVNADSDAHSSPEVYVWLADNAYQYGFIQRYPEEKSGITGIANEPWHYRYVGAEAAKEIHDGGLCLEEYLANLPE